MTEYDNDPQRPPAAPDDRPTQHIAEQHTEGPPAAAGPRDADVRDGSGPPDSGAEHGQAPVPPVAQPSSPAGPAPHQASLPPWAVPVGMAGASGTGGAPATPGAPGAAGAPYQAYPGNPYPEQAGMPGAPGSPGVPGGTGAPQSGPPFPGAGQAGGPYPGGGGQQPPWAQPVAGAGHRPPSRFGRVLVTGAAVVALAVGSGLFGGFIATQLDDDAATSVTGENRPAEAAPVLQRDSLAGIADKVQPSVVSISTGTGEGSGVVLTEDGYVLTNNHVVASAQGDTVSVVFADGKTAKAKIIGTDPKTDLAVIKAEGVSGLRPAQFGDSNAMQVGDTVLALGSPLGLQGSVTAGIVSALDRTIQVGGEQQEEPQLPQLPQRQSSGAQSMAGLLQTDAPINPGNSGGALVNLNGEVIGINTAIATSGQGQGNIGVGFAIPSNKAKLVAEQLKSGGKVSHPFLGVSVTDAEGGNGAQVGTVQPNSPAAKVGVQKGDVITQLGDKKINGSEDLVSAVQSGKVGDRLQLNYIRNGEQKTATVTLAEAS